MSNEANKIPKGVIGHFKETLCAQKDFGFEKKFVLWDLKKFEV